MAASSLSITSSSPPPWVSTRTIKPSLTPSASLSLHTGFRTRSNLSMNAGSSSNTHPALLHTPFLSSSFSGLSFGWDFSSSSGTRKEKGFSFRLVVKAGKFTLCQTKRNRSRKSLARTHGFRRRMRTTSGRAILKRRRAKGRKVLCTKSNPNSGKYS